MRKGGEFVESVESTTHGDHLTATAKVGALIVNADDWGGTRKPPIASWTVFYAERFLP